GAWPILTVRAARGKEKRRGAGQRHAIGHSAQRDPGPVPRSFASAGARLRDMSERTFDLPGRDPLLPWLIFTGLSLFAFLVLWYFGLIEQMVASDRTYISSVIGLLYVASSLHCLWRIIVISREGDAAVKTARVVVHEGGFLTHAPAGGRDGLPRGLVAVHI